MLVMTGMRLKRNFTVLLHPGVDDFYHFVLVNGLSRASIVCSSSSVLFYI